jgi:hypothetical protein
MWQIQGSGNLYQWKALARSYIFKGFKNSGWLMFFPELKKKKLNSVACSPQANYTDREAAAC